MPFRAWSLRAYGFLAWRYVRWATPSAHQLVDLDDRQQDGEHDHQHRRAHRQDHQRLEQRGNTARCAARLSTARACRSLGLPEAFFDYDKTGNAIDLTIP